MRTSDFLYPLPPDRIAQTPIESRHDARLLDTRDMSDHRFLDLAGLLEAGDLVVVNNTRVRHARLRGVKADSGGEVEVILLGISVDGSWTALVRRARRIRIGTVLHLEGIDAEVLSDPDDGVVELALRMDGDIEATIERIGGLPLPPYIETDLADPDRYQTVYASRVGSAAAPTAGLHFTESVFSRLEDKSISVAAVDLEVGLATFKPIVTEEVEDHRMHTERYEVPQATAAEVQACRSRGGRVVSVGTTTLRALESSATPDGSLLGGPQETDLFIRPGFRFSVVDLLVTNFHHPRSSLLVMLEAFMGPGWRRAYDHALSTGYRFLSFGDAMLCTRPS